MLARSTQLRAFRFCTLDQVEYSAELSHQKKQVRASLVILAATLQPLDESSSLVRYLNATAAMDSEMHTLKAAEDRFGGVVIDSLSLPHDVSVFVDSLKHSLVQWRAQGKRGVWLKLPLGLSHLVHPAIQEGFNYHHAENTYVMLVTWIADIPSTIPANASHQVGIGAFVLNDKHEILAVQEKSGVFQGAGIWKMPTGSVNQGEDIFAGAIREVKEETGIDTEFVEVIGFRQAHKVTFEKSDIFFLCVLRPLNSEITIQDSELTAVKWMPLAEYRDQAYLKQRKLLKKMLDVCTATIEEPGYKGFQIRDMQAGATGRRPQYFYYNAVDCQE